MVQIDERSLPEIGETYLSPPLIGLWPPLYLGGDKSPLPKVLRLTYSACG